MTILAIDPGSAKCGVAVVRSISTGTESQFENLWRGIIQTTEMATNLAALLAEYSVEQVIIGNATTSRQARILLERQWPQMPVTIVDETGSTLEARTLFWKENPPTGWRRLLPLSLQTPPRPIDDFAAEVLALRFFQDGDMSSGYSKNVHC